MSDSDSDESLNTEDLNEINSSNNNQFEEEETVEVEEKGIEREKQTKKVKKSDVKPPAKKAESKPKRERTEAQKQATLRMLELNKKRKEDKLKNKSENEIKSEPKKKSEPKPKKPPTEKQLAARANLVKINKARAEARKEGKDTTGKVGRKGNTINVIKEKIIYMMPDGNGDYKKVKPPVITDIQRKKQEQIKKNEAEFEEIQEKATKLLRKTKHGKVDGRSQKTPAQLKALEKAREKAKIARDAKLKEKREKDKNELKETITDSVLDVVSKPATEIKEKKEKKRITEEQKKLYKFKKDLSLFS